MPAPYEVREERSGRLTIHHRPFNARVSEVFETRDSLERALASLLIGEPLPGTGEFSYRGQSLQLCDPIDLGLLPQRPILPANLVQSEAGYCALGYIDFAPGFTPVSPELFATVKEVELAWRRDVAGVQRYVALHANKIWGVASTLDLSKLNDRHDVVPECGHSDLASLRALYPELSMLSDETLYVLFDSYHYECFHASEWIPTRTDSFLFYLLATRDEWQVGQGEAKEDAGMWVAYSLLPVPVMLITSAGQS